MADYGIKKLLNRFVTRISTPAQEVRDMLGAMGDVLANAYGPIGTTYWVGGTNALSTNDGLTWLKPLTTITAALALCTSGNNDVIRVLDYWRPSGETWPIQINKKRVHIIGSTQPNFPAPTFHPADDVAAFAVNESGSYGSIENLTIGGGSSSAGIRLGGVTGVNTKPEGFLIKNCLFGHSWFGTPDHGIESVEYGSMGCRIENCTFLGDLKSVGGALAENAIEFTTTAANNDNLQLVNNIFLGVAIGINLAKGPGAVITGNRFLCADSANGEAITLGASVVGCMIDDNEAMEGVLVMTYNPFKDLGTNHWGDNKRAGISIAPVTS